MSNVLIHVGLHKTGTTTLQRRLFPHWDGVTYFADEPLVIEFVRAAVLNDTAYFDAEMWQGRMKQLTVDKPLAVISNESFSGALYAGIGKRGLDHRTPILQNLQSTFPEARILLVLRRQDTLARSLYRQYLKVGGTESICQFYGVDTGQSPIFPLQRFDFGPYVDMLHDLFPERVLVLTYEEFAKKQDEFLDKLGRFIGLPPPAPDPRRSNESRFGAFGMEVSRLTNFLFRSRLNRGGLLPGIPVIRNGRLRLISLSSVIHNRWPKRSSVSGPGTSRIDSVCSQILEAQRLGNEALDQKYGLGLHAHGYY